MRAGKDASIYFFGIFLYLGLVLIRELAKVVRDGFVSFNIGPAIINCFSHDLRCSCLPILIHDQTTAPHGASADFAE